MAFATQGLYYLGPVLTSAILPRAYTTQGLRAYTTQGLQGLYYQGQYYLGSILPRAYIT
jgi:hypothetical protein